MSAYPDKFIDDVIAVWQPDYDKPLSREDAREIADNLSGFVETLLEWEAKAKGKPELEIAGGKRQ